MLCVAIVPFESSDNEKYTRTALKAKIVELKFELLLRPGGSENVWLEKFDVEQTSVLRIIERIEKVWEHVEKTNEYIVF